MQTGYGSSCRCRGTRWSCAYVAPSDSSPPALIQLSRGCVLWLVAVTQHNRLWRVLRASGGASLSVALGEWRLPSFSHRAQYLLDVEYPFCLFLIRVQDRIADPCFVATSQQLKKRFLGRAENLPFCPKIRGFSVGC